MNFFICDDDPAIRTMLIDIIEDYDLGEVVGEGENGASVNSSLLAIKNIDILIIDLLMPVKDGLHCISDLGSSYAGKIIMLSQIEDKEMIAQAYSLGVEYYITKPINRIEVIKVIEKVIENLKLHKSISEIQSALNIITNKKPDKKEHTHIKKTIISSGQFLLTELGMIGESGSKDLLDMINYLFHLESEKVLHEFPSLKAIFDSVANLKLGPLVKEDEIKKEVKASEQRVRRCIYQGLNHVASIGLTDYSNPKFEEYAGKFFDFTEVRKKMLELEDGFDSSLSSIHINMKKFVKVLYLESKKML